MCYFNVKKYLKPNVEDMLSVSNLSVNKHKLNFSLYFK